MRSIVVIDGTYLHYAKKESQWDIDIAKLAGFMSNGMDVIWTKYYTGYREPCPEVFSKFLGWLASQGIRSGTRPVRVAPDGLETCNLKPHLVTDVCTTIHGWDRIALLAGDEDLAYMCKKLRTFGKRIDLYGFDGMISSRLKYECDTITKLDDWIGSIVK